MPPVVVSIRAMGAGGKSNVRDGGCTTRVMRTMKKVGARRSRSHAAEYTYRISAIVVESQSRRANIQYKMPTCVRIPSMNAAGQYGSQH